MRAFYKQYGEKGYVNIYQRFGFSSAAQVDAFYDYLTYLIKYSLFQNTAPENQAMG
jgi:hypothetical protein